MRHHNTGTKHLQHPVVGDLDLTFEALALPADPGMTMIVYGAEPDSPSHDALKLVASWAATLDEHDAAQPASAVDGAQ